MMNHPMSDIEKSDGHRLDSETSEAVRQLQQSIDAKNRLSQPVYDMLDWAAKRIGYTPPRSGITYVLSINPGDSYDMRALNSFFGGRAHGQANEATHIYAVERSTPLYEEGRKYNSRLTYKNKDFVIEPPDYFHFINADPADLNSLPLPGQFHAVVMRTPDISNERDPWQRTLRDAIEMLAPEGIAIVTTFNTPIESLPLRRRFLGSNYDELLHDVNPHAQFIEGKQIQVDALVTVVRKSASYVTPAAPALPEGYQPGTVNEITTREVVAFPSREMAADA
jgi:SAM-dependent methyltransferase